MLLIYLSPISAGAAFTVDSSVMPDRASDNAEGPSRAIDLYSGAGDFNILLLCRTRGNRSLTALSPADQNEKDRGGYSS